MNPVNSIWDSKAEKEVFQFLLEIINSDYFYVFPHLPISDVFCEYKDFTKFKESFHAYCKFCNTDPGETHFELSHFDFIIFNRDYLPVLIIEIDGWRHKKYQAVRFFDQFKERIAENHGVPLARILLHNQNMDIKKTLKNELIALDLEEPNNYPVYCPDCRRKLIYHEGDYSPYYGCCSCKNQKTGNNLNFNINRVPRPPIFLFDSLETPN